LIRFKKSDIPLIAVKKLAALKRKVEVLRSLGLIVKWI
jgi:hypothetical protein